MHGMRHDEVKDNLRALTFDSFFWFSRFEFALKEAPYLRWEQEGAAASPSWQKFAAKYRADYQPGPAARALLDAAPQQQVVGAGRTLTFAPVLYNPGVADLDKVIELANTVRNNLFHGGKHGSAYWDDPARTEMLLKTTIGVLDELARLGGLEADYTGYY